MSKYGYFVTRYPFQSLEILIDDCGISLLLVLTPLTDQEEAPRTY